MQIRIMLKIMIDAVADAVGNAKEKFQSLCFESRNVENAVAMLEK